MSVRTSMIALGAAAAAVSAATASAQAAEEVNIYTSRQPELIKPILEAFTEDTGIAVNTVFAKKGLEERLKAEGLNSPADLVLTVDVGRLSDIIDAGLTQPVTTDTLTENVPAEYRGPNGEWYALTSRARVLYVSKERVEEGAIDSYLDLADDRWEGRICTRPGDHQYNIGLIAGMIHNYGEEKTRAWLQGVKENLGRKPQGNDRAQVKAVKEGECDIAVGNTYYMGKMMTNPDQRAWAEAVNIVFPDQDEAGTHINISGVVMTQSAPNKDNAIQLMEFLTSDTAQKLYAEANFEYPVKPGVPWSDMVRSWGEFKADDEALLAIAEFRDEALRMVNELDYNAGP